MLSLIVIPKTKKAERCGLCSKWQYVHLKLKVWGGRREEGSGWGTHVYLWWIHFDIWQN